MRQNVIGVLMIKRLSSILLIGVMLLASVATATIHASAQKNDVIAKVGDQSITFNEIDVMINSSSMVGLTMPPPGTPARNTLRMTLLDKIISANLLYLDALRHGVDKNAVYQREVADYADTILAGLYREKYLVGKIEVTDQEIMDYFQKNIKEGTPFTKDVGEVIGAKLHKEKFKKRISDMRARLRKDVKVAINTGELLAEQDGQRNEDTVLAHIDNNTVTWAELRPLLAGAGGKKTVDDRLEILNKHIDQRIMTSKARDAGMEKDPAYLSRVNEYKKVRLVNMHRTSLIRDMEPSDDEIKQYFEMHKDKISMPEARKIQMLVLDSEQKAIEVKEKIASGEMTIYQAAIEYSIDPNAKKNLGEIGWVPQGTGFPELDKVTFSLSPEFLGGPVKSPAGWHLVKVLDVQPATMNDIKDKETRKKTRRLLLNDKRNEYVVALRKNIFPVKVYQNVINQLMNEEAGRYAKEVKTTANTSAVVE